MAPARINATPDTATCSQKRLGNPERPVQLAGSPSQAATSPKKSITQSPSCVPTA